MRALTATLALFGCPWVVLGFWGAFVIVGYPSETFGSKPLYTLYTALLFSLGYFIWWGWVFFSFTKRFPFVSTRTFWTLSLIQHALAIFWVSKLGEDYRGGNPLPFTLSVTANALISAIILVRRPWDGPNAEQGSDGKPDTVVS